MESIISLFSKFGRKTLVGAASWSLAAVLTLSSAQAHIIYKYYEVVGGDTIESIASRYSIDPKEVLRVNANTIVSQKGLQAGSILLIPIDTEAKPVPTKIDVNGAESGPAPSLVSISNSAAGSGSKAAKKKMAKRRSYRSPSAPAPSYSIAVGSDGKIVKIPNYIPPSDDEDWDENYQSSGRVNSLLSKAKSYMGVPYVWGGSTPSGFDCSGYVQYVYNQVGISLPRTADIQFNEGRAVALGQEVPGDMVFFETYAPGASHVGIYLGNGEFIHASSSGSVKVSSLDESYFKARYLGAKRVL
ncbi:MAG: NlpC/P60 family protein [Candidatus Bruticola sp.]